MKELKSDYYFNSESQLIERIKINGVVFTKNFHSNTIYAISNKIKNKFNFLGINNSLKDEAIKFLLENNIKDNFKVDITQYNVVLCEHGFLATVTDKNSRLKNVQVIKLSTDVKYIRYEKNVFPEYILDF